MTEHAPEVHEETSSVRRPPQNLEAEACVLGSIMIDSDVIMLLDDLKGDDFYSTNNRLIFEAMSALKKVGRPVDAVTVKDHLSKIGELESLGGLEALIGIMDAVPSSAHVVDYANIVKDCSFRRQMIKSSSDIRELAWDMSKKDVAGKASVMMSKILDKSATGAVKVNLGKTITEVFERVDAAKNDDSQAIRRNAGTAIYDRIGMGVPEKSLNIIAARPGRGKTTFAMHCQRRMAAQGMGAGFITMEQPKEELVVNHVAAQANVARDRIIKGKITKTDWERIMHAINELEEMPLVTYEAFGFDWSRLRSLIYRMATLDKCDVVFIDYLSRIKLPPKTTVKDFYSQITWGLKTMAQELDLRVFLLCQLNRDIEKEKKPRAPQQSDLKDCGSIEQDADTIVFPHSTEKDRSIWTELIMEKNRGGPIGSINYMWHRHKSFFEEPSPWQNGKQEELPGINEEPDVF